MCARVFDKLIMRAFSGYRSVHFSHVNLCQSGYNAGAEEASQVAAFSPSFCLSQWTPNIRAGCAPGGASGGKKRLQGTSPTLISFLVSSAFSSFTFQIHHVAREVVLFFLNSSPKTLERG